MTIGEIADKLNRWVGKIRLFQQHGTMPRSQLVQLSQDLLLMHRRVEDLLGTTRQHPEEAPERGHGEA